MSSRVSRSEKLWILNSAYFFFQLIWHTWVILWIHMDSKWQLWWAKQQTHLCCLNVNQQKINHCRKKTNAGTKTKKNENCQPRSCQQCDKSLTILWWCTASKRRIRHYLAIACRDLDPVRSRFDRKNRIWFRQDLELKTRLYSFAIGSQFKNYIRIRPS